MRFDTDRDALVNVLTDAPDHGGWRAGMEPDDYAALADALLASDWLAARDREVRAEALRSVREAAADDVSVWSFRSWLNRCTNEIEARS